MCGRFKMLTMDEVTEVIHLIQMHAPFNCLPDWPAGPDVRPGAIAPVIVPGIGELGKSSALQHAHRDGARR